MTITGLLIEVEQLRERLAEEKRKVAQADHDQHELANQIGTQYRLFENEISALKGFVGLLLEEIGDATQDHRTVLAEDTERLHRLLDEVSCKTCHGTGLVTSSEEHTDECPDCRQYGFLAPQTCRCVKGTDQCYFCAGQDARRDTKTWA